MCFSFNRILPKVAKKQQVSFLCDEEYLHDIAFLFDEEYLYGIAFLSLMFVWYRIALSFWFKHFVMNLPNKLEFLEMSIVSETIM